MLRFNCSRISQREFSTLVRDQLINLPTGKAFQLAVPIGLTNGYLAAIALSPEAATQRS